MDKAKELEVKETMAMIRRNSKQFRAYLRMSLKNQVIWDMIRRTK